MKKFLLGIVALATLGLFASCSHEPSPIDGGEEAMVIEPGKGGLILNVDFSKSLETRAATTITGLPITNWTSVPKIYVVFSDVAGEIQNVRQVNSAANGKIKFNNIAKGTYKISIIANANDGEGKGNISGVWKNSGTEEAFTWLQGNLKGKKLEDLYLYYPKGTKPAGSTSSAMSSKQFFTSPAEIFTAHGASSIVIKEDDVTIDPNSYRLTREVSMMRLRIMKNVTKSADGNVEGVEQNRSVNFSDAKAYAVLHNISTKGITANDKGVVENTAEQSTRVYEASGTGVFKFMNPVTADGYAGTLSNFIDIENNPTTAAQWDKYVAWSDLVVLPSVDRNGAVATIPTTKRAYTLVLAGLAPVGYTTLEGTVLTAATPVYWRVPLPNSFLANRIHEINVKLLYPGSIDEPTDPVGTGTVEITVETVAWDTPVDVTVEL